jgi:hypothetical protein
MLDTIPNEKRKCHRCNFDKSCRELVMSGDCQRWAKISGANPQTGEPLDRWSCIDDLQHILLLEIGNQTNKVSVELNVLRNETAKAHSESMTLGSIAVQRASDAVRESFSKTLVDFLPDRKMKLIDSQA